MKTVPLDGLDALRSEIELKEIMRLIEKTARWVDPRTFQLLPVWYPEHARQTLFYKSDWSEPQPNVNRETKQSVHKKEGNTYANKALTYALGLGSSQRPNWSCCHIWGVDDPRFQTGNLVVQDRRFYSCVANMVLLPTPLKAFTDVMPEVKAMLRICAGNLYGWWCDHEVVSETAQRVRLWSDWEAYPKSWPRERGFQNVPGLMPFNGVVKKRMTERLTRIARDLDSAGDFYPRQEVRSVLDYWQIDLADRQQRIEGEAP